LKQVYRDLLSFQIHIARIVERPSLLRHAPSVWATSKQGAHSRGKISVKGIRNGADRSSAIAHETVIHLRTSIRRNTGEKNF
jgi:hypothetical protein